ncbi:hypothetical protein [Spirosoma endbachense]|uniref:Uncharacterized protein n=1 Tax=Spirosoma endbachense TaxID=2666025 RepID=A0A6P1W499_9BACT|nr:hypothetical protein [Spirosoma endbachense]QHV99388.1 hypothetical protein GJR95_32175 [Spirosoma endbachense]
MNLSFSISTVGRTHHHISFSNEPPEEGAQPSVDDSSDEGDEYLDDALRMTEQTFDRE